MKEVGFTELTSQPGVVQQLGAIPRQNRLIKADVLVAAIDEESAAEHPAPKDAQLTLRKNGDTVEAIMVTCNCGKTTEIFLDYDEDAKTRGGGESK